MPYDYEVERFRGPYALELSASPGDSTVHVQFRDGRRLAFGSQNELAQYLKPADRELVKFYWSVTQALGQTYNVFAKRDIDQKRGTVFLGVTFDRERIRPKRWVHEATDEVGELVADLRKAGFSPKVEGERFAQIMVTVRSVPKAVHAFEIIDAAVQASPMQWGW